MHLTEQNMASYLLGKGLLPAKQLVDGDFRVDPADSRNRNFIVNRDGDNALFIKHIKIRDAEKTTTLRSEATCYWLANHDEQYAQLKAHIPAYRDFDYNNHILILDYEKGSVSLYDYYLQNGISSLPIARQLGRILVSFHANITSERMDAKTSAFFRKQKPWIFSLIEAEKFIAQSAGRKAEEQFFKLISGNSDFKTSITGLEKEWNATSFTHNDIKLTNFVLPQDYRDDHDSSEPPLKLIDWEMADIGDPAWDLASLFQSWLGFWVSTESEGRPSMSFSLPQIQPAIRACWETYGGLMDFDAINRAAFLKKTVRFTALKILHTAYESTVNAENLSPFTARLLQLSLNILKSPELAQQSVFGIS